MIFLLIFNKNIDFGYSLEPASHGSNGYQQFNLEQILERTIYTPIKPSSTIQKWGPRGLNVIEIFALCNFTVLVDQIMRLISARLSP